VIILSQIQQEVLFTRVRKHTSQLICLIYEKSDGSLTIASAVCCIVGGGGFIIENNLMISATPSYYQQRTFQPNISNFNGNKHYSTYFHDPISFPEGRFPYCPGQNPKTTTSDNSNPFPTKISNRQVAIVVDM